MQRAWLFPVAVAVAVGALIVSTVPSATGEPSFEDFAPAVSAHADELHALDTYVDPDFGFSLAVPAGWTAVIAVPVEAGPALLEPGYAIGFESPREGDGDIFSDYLMVEILPGDESGLFRTDGSLVRETRVDGRIAWRDALTLAADPGIGSAVDLIVRQAAMAGLGYTVGLYAIGEPARLELLEDAFEVMLRTFRLPTPPFTVS